MIQQFNVGGIFTPLKDVRGDGTYFIRDMSGFILIDHMTRPTAAEIEDHKAGAGFQIQIGEVSGQIVVCTKCGSQPWCDTTFEPRLYTDAVTYERPANSEGYSLTVLLTDAPGAEIKSIRLIGLGHDISEYLYGLVRARLDAGGTVTYSQNQTASAMLQMQYATSDLVRLTNTHRWKLR